MSITTYSELQTAILAYVNNMEIEPQITTFIAMTEADLNRKLRARDMQKRVTTTTASGSEYYDTPDDFLEMRHIQINSGATYQLRYMSPETLIHDYPQTAIGLPRAFTVLGDEIRFRPIPDAVYTVEIQYWARLVALSAGNPTNWLLTYNPDVYLFGSLLHASAYVNEDQRTLWAEGYANAIATLNRTAKTGNYPAGVSVSVA